MKSVSRISKPGISKSTISNQSTTKRRAIEASQGLLQRYGYNGFSFQHVADAVGIKKPSLYEHFVSKEALGILLIEDYEARFRDWIKITRVFAPREKILALFELFYEFARDQQKFCPLTALIAEINSLPPAMCTRLRRMHKLQKSWLEKVIVEGKKSKEFKNPATSQKLSELLMSLAYGAQLSARISKDPQHLRTARQQAIAILDRPFKI